MLQRHVEILDSLSRFSDGGKERVRNVCRIGVHHADPFELVDLAEGSYELRKQIDLAEVLAVPRRILRDEDDLPDAL